MMSLFESHSSPKGHAFVMSDNFTLGGLRPGLTRQPKPMQPPPAVDLCYSLKAYDMLPVAKEIFAAGYIDDGVLIQDVTAPQSWLDVFCFDHLPNKSWWPFEEAEALLPAHCDASVTGSTPKNSSPTTSLQQALAARTLEERLAGAKAVLQVEPDSLDSTDARLLLLQCMPAGAARRDALKREAVKALPVLEAERKHVCATNAAVRAGGIFGMWLLPRAAALQALRVALAYLQDGMHTHGQQLDGRGDGGSHGAGGSSQSGGGAGPFEERDVRALVLKEVVAWDEQVMGGCLMAWMLQLERFGDCWQAVLDLTNTMPADTKAVAEMTMLYHYSRWFALHHSASTVMEAADRLAQEEQALAGIKETDPQCWVPRLLAGQVLADPEHAPSFALRSFQEAMMCVRLCGKYWAKEAMKPKSMLDPEAVKQHGLHIIADLLCATGTMATCEAGDLARCDNMAVARLLNAGVHDAALKEAERVYEAFWPTHNQATETDEEGFIRNHKVPSEGAQRALVNILTIRAHALINQPGHTQHSAPSAASSPFEHNVHSLMACFKRIGQNMLERLTTKEGGDYDEYEVLRAAFRRSLYSCLLRTVWQGRQGPYLADQATAPGSLVDCVCNGRSWPAAGGTDAKLPTHAAQHQLTLLLLSGKEGMDAFNRLQAVGHADRAGSSSTSAGGGSTHRSSGGSSAGSSTGTAAAAAVPRAVATSAAAAAAHAEMQPPGVDAGSQAVCAQCGAGGRMKRCGGCSEVCYCSSTCAKQHWRSVHRQACSRTLLFQGAAAAGTTGAGM